MHSIFKRLALIFVLTLGVVSCKKEDKELPENYVTSIKDYKFLPIVEVTINNFKAYMVLDTGASVSVLDLRQSAIFGVKDFGEQEIGIAGYGGVDTTVHAVGRTEIKIGNILMNNGYVGKDITSIVQTVKDHTGYTIVGILGNNNISKAGLKLDFAKGVITK